MDVHVELAQLLLEQGEVEEALQLLERVATLTPDLTGLSIDLGRVLLQAGRASEAAGYLTTAVEESPERADLWSLLGRAHAEAGDFDAARASYERAIELAPENPAFRMNLAMCLDRAGRFDEAIDTYRAALLQNPGNPQMVNNLARLLASTSDAPNAAADALALAERLSSNLQRPEPAVLDTLGIALARAGRFEEAIAVAEQAAEVAEKHGRRGMLPGIRERIALYRLGTAYRRN